MDTVHTRVFQDFGEVASSAGVGSVGLRGPDRIFVLVTKRYAVDLRMLSVKWDKRTPKTQTDYRDVHGFAIQLYHNCI